MLLAPTALVDDSYMRKKLHVVDVESGKILARVDNPGKIGDVVWSPDGTHLATISGADPHDPLEGRLMVVPAGGGELRDVLPGWDEGHVHAVAWKDAETLIFLAYERTGSFVGRVRRTGTDLERFPSSDEVIVRDLSLSRDGRRAALIGSSSRHPGKGHGNRRAASRLDYNLRLMRWMNRYLQGPGGPPPPAELTYEREGASWETPQN